MESLSPWRSWQGLGLPEGQVVGGDNCLTQSLLFTSFSICATMKKSFAQLHPNLFCATYILSLAKCVLTIITYVKKFNFYFGKFPALLRRATTYKHQNKLQEAIEDLSKVLDVEPDNELAKVSTESDSSPNSVVCYVCICVTMISILLYR